MGCCYTIPQSEIGIIERFGKFEKQLDAGCHCVNPMTTSLRGKLTTRVTPLSMAVESKTKDNVFCNVAVTIQYQVHRNEVKKAFYELTDTVRQLKSYVFNNVRAQIPHYELDQLFIAKDEIAQQLKEDLEHEVNQFGYTIVQTLITDIEPDPTVKKAMNDINAAQRLRVAAGDKAEAEKITIVKAAEADAESKRLSGVGLAEQRKAVVMGLHESIKMFSEHTDISQMEVMELLLMNQYFDTLKEMTVGQQTSTIFVPNGQSALADQIRDGTLQASRAK